jgi:hypothetical protein
VRSDELGHCIRAWRDRLDPAALGTPDAENLALLGVVGLQRMAAG